MTFLPREEKFFALFVNQVKLIVEASRLMREAVQAGNAHMARASEEIRTLEGKGDEIIAPCECQQGQASKAEQGSAARKPIETIGKVNGIGHANDKD